LQQATPRHRRHGSELVIGGTTEIAHREDAIPNESACPSHVETSRFPLVDKALLLFEGKAMPGTDGRHGLPKRGLANDQNQSLSFQYSSGSPASSSRTTLNARLGNLAVTLSW